MNRIIIDYDPDSANAGEPIDLLSYLMNELDSADIETTIREVEDVSPTER
jgi:hypothetical protein